MNLVSMLTKVRFIELAQCKTCQTTSPQAIETN